MLDMVTLNSLDDFLFNNSKYTPSNYNRIIFIIVIIVLIISIGAFIYIRKRREKDEIK